MHPLSYECIYYPLFIRYPLVNLSLAASGSGAYLFDSPTVRRLSVQFTYRLMHTSSEDCLALYIRQPPGKTWTSEVFTHRFSDRLLYLLRHYPSSYLK